jgi:presenilin-like A22 family membrane protease
MKHNWRITTTLVLFFLVAQVIGLLIVNKYIDHKTSIEKKDIVMKPLPYNLERPEIKNKSSSFVYITISLIMGTMLVLLLVKFNKPVVWRVWFFATVVLTLSIALAAFIDAKIAFAIALALAVLKIYRQNVITQNISEIFIYGGLAAVFVPIMNLFAAFMLLIVISVYDFIAVFKTKHMIKLANFQSESKVFAGLLIPYDNKTPIKVHAAAQKTEAKKSSHSVAVLGGGDIGFTLIFAGVVMKGLMLQQPENIAFLKTLLIPLFCAASLLFLLIKGQKNKFYPAMPVLSIGCIIGYFATALI